MPRLATPLTAAKAKSAKPGRHHCPASTRGVDQLQEKV